MALLGPSLLAAATGDDDDTEVESFELETIRGSGIVGHVILLDNGIETVYVGVATGLTLDIRYVSLIYDTDSEEDGPEACEPGIDPDTPLTDDQMVIGLWMPVDSSIRTLEMRPIIGFDADGPIPGPRLTSITGPEYTPIDDIGTMSIRGPPFFGPPGVVACGEID